MTSEMRESSVRSGRALDALNFFLADVRDGLGPYLAIFLRSTRHWDPSRIGIVMAAMTIASVVAQTPAGALIDASRRKRAIVAVGCVAVAVGCLAMLVRPTMPVILSAQIVIGSAAAIFAPAIAAITLGMVGHRALSRRMGRNEAFNHGGNVAAAVLAGALGDWIAYEAVFALVAAMCAASIASVLLIREEDIDHTQARGASPASEAGLSGVGALLADRRILTFSVAVVLFHFANAAMLPLVGQKLTEGHDHGVATAMSACIIVAQLVMIPTALLASRGAERWGRKPVFLIGFAVLPVRGLLYTLTNHPTALVAIQALDGIGAGIFGVVSVLVVADLTQGTGRFNVMQGALATALGIGASLSNLATGYIVSVSSFNIGFLFLAGVAAVALLFFGMMMPETAKTKGKNARGSARPSTSSAAGRRTLTAASAG